MIRVFKQLSLLIALTLVAGAVSSQETQTPKTAQQIYLEGVGLYQKQQWDQAAEKWSQALQLEPENPYILYNLGLAEIQLQKLAWAVAHFRKAAEIKPGIKDLNKALSQTLSQLGIPAAKSLDFWSAPTRFLLKKIHPAFFMITFMLLLWLSLWHWLTYIGRRKRAIDQANPLPHFPLLALTLSVFTAIVLSLVVVKSIQSQQTKATIVEKDLFAKSGPTAEATDLFQLRPGTEVLLQKTSGEWIQARNKGGLVGWIPLTAVYQTSGETP